MNAEINAINSDQRSVQGMREKIAIFPALLLFKIPRPCLNKNGLFICIAHDALKYKYIKDQGWTPVTHLELKNNRAQWNLERPSRIQHRAHAQQKGTGRHSLFSLSYPGRAELQHWSTPALKHHCQLDQSLAHYWVRRLALTLETGVACYYCKSNSMFLRQLGTFGYQLVNFKHNSSTENMDHEEKLNMLFLTKADQKYSDSERAAGW